MKKVSLILTFGYLILFSLYPIYRFSSKNDFFTKSLRDYFPLIHKGLGSWSFYTYSQGLQQVRAFYYIKEERSFLEYSLDEVRSHKDQLFLTRPITKLRMGQYSLHVLTRNLKNFSWLCEVYKVSNKNRAYIVIYNSFNDLEIIPTEILRVMNNDKSVSYEVDHKEKGRIHRLQVYSFRCG